MEDEVLAQYNEEWLSDETFAKETSTVTKCSNKGCGFNDNNNCKANGTLCFGYMEDE